tara:strand:+ start:1308 stop:1493 length:186 start_codon:yes stop_codon:yes gene_type:complete
MSDKPLSDARQQELRANGIIAESEIAIKVGDLHVAQNVVTGIRRVISLSASVTETKQVLRG